MTALEPLRSLVDLIWSKLCHLRSADTFFKCTMFLKGQTAFLLRKRLFEEVVDDGLWCVVGILGRGACAKYIAGGDINCYDISGLPQFAFFRLRWYYIFYCLPKFD